MGAGPSVGSRPRGVSDNVPQEAIDELMREDPTIGDMPQTYHEPSFGVPPTNTNAQSTNQETIIPKQAEDDQEVIQPKKKAEPARRVITLPEEPAADNADSTKIVFRMPLSGERIERRFLKEDKISLIYDFVDHLQNEEKCKFDGVESYTDQYEIL